MDVKDDAIRQHGAAKQLAEEHFIGEGKPYYFLRDCNILWVEQDVRVPKGYSVGKVNGLWRWQTGYDIVIRIRTDWWESFETHEERLAYLDHILAHIELTDEDSYVIKEPDLQMFSAVAARHQEAYLERMQEHTEGIAQMQFDFEPEVRSGELAATNNV